MSQGDQVTQILVTLGKIETQLGSLTQIVEVIHKRIDEREEETVAVGKVAQENTTRLAVLEPSVESLEERIKELEQQRIADHAKITVLETLAAANRNWIVIGGATVGVIAIICDLIFK